MSKKLIELREARNKSVVAARALLDLATTEKRDLTEDENKQYESHMGDQQERADEIGREERTIEAERDLAGQNFTPNTPENEDRSDLNNPLASPEYRAAYDTFLRGGKDAISPDEARALSAGNGTEGGFLVMPQQMAAGLIKAIDNKVIIRQRANVIQLPFAASLGAASLDNDPADPTWTSEIATGSEDSTMSLGKRELTPHPLAQRIKVSNKLLRVVPDAESLVMSRLAYKFGVVEEAAYMTGDGAKSPLGLFTASNDGIPTGRDVSDGNTNTAFTFDGLINAKYSVKGQYQDVGEWIFHRDAVKMLAKLKDGEGQYIWQPSKTLADPDLLLGNALLQSEYAPSTFTTGLYVGLFGDLSNYWIVDALNIQVQRLIELYAETNQTGFIGRLESDGMPVLSEAFARVKLT